MRGPGLKAVAAAIAAVFVVSFASVFEAGSSAVMADEKTVAPGTIFYPGDTFSVSSYTYFDMDDYPDSVIYGFHDSTYTFGDSFSWDDEYGQWCAYLILYGETETVSYPIYDGYQSTDGSEHPVAYKCISGNGTQGSPYVFVFVYDEVLQPGVVFYPGDSFTLNANAYFDMDDDPRFGVREIRPGLYVFSHAFSYSFGFGQWMIGLNINNDLVFCLGHGVVNGSETPVAVMCTGGNGYTSDTAYTFELVTPMYRLYNPNSGEHFYTSNVGERNNLISLGWNDEGIGWYAPIRSNTPVYRLYNRNGGEHHYTTNAGERDSLVALGWEDEGIGWYSDDSQRIPLYRQYNPNAFANNHNYTTSLQENNDLVALGWRAEAIGWYGVGA